MEALANFVGNVLVIYGSDSPEFDRALCSLAAAAREKGLRGSSALAVLAGAIGAGQAAACPVPGRDSAPLG